jgi:GNAT superfamily N-acetyltransferase
VRPLCRAAVVGYDLVVVTRQLTRDEIQLIWTIDRSEVHHNIFKVVAGRLTLVPAYFEIPGWHPTTIEADTIRIRDCLDRGGFVRGAFHGSELVGVAVVDTKPIKSLPDHLQLFYLYVSRPVRGQGIGRQLFADAADAACDLGATALYISAVPTENTVNFYLRRGASVLEAPDPDLLQAEPDDIHLTFRAGRESRVSRAGALTNDA